MAASFAAMTRLLADTSVRALLLAALSATVLRFWGRHNANFQHRAWTAVLWGMLLLPLLAQFTPALSLLPAGWRWESGDVVRQTIPTDSNLAGQPAQLASAGARSQVAALGESVDFSPAQQADIASEVSERGFAASSLPTHGVATDSAERRAAAMPEIPAFGWRGVIVALYLFGVVLLLSRLALGYWIVYRLVRRATDIPRPLGCRSRVATSDAVRVPVSVGLLRPVILLPVDWSCWSDALLASVVMHEQAHIDRRDHLVLLASELNRCLYWFHPVAWFLRRRLSALAEQCCDDTVIAALQSRAAYARHLLEIATRLTTNPRRAVPLGISMARGSQVESRIVAILDERRPLAGRLGRGGMLALAAIVGPIVLLAAGLRAADPPPQRQPATAAEEPVAPAAEATAKAESTAQAEAGKPTVKGVSVSGRVVLASDGSPAASAEVRLLSIKKGPRVDVRRTKTDEQGGFAFADVPAGPHRLVALLDDLASQGERAQPTLVKIAKDHPPEPVLLKLSPAPSIAVHVTSQADGSPVAGARVRPNDLFYPWDEQTDAQGNVVLRGLKPAAWSIEVRAAGFAEKKARFELKGDARAELNFALDPGGKMHGMVKNQDGKPVANLQVGVRFRSMIDSPEPLEGTQTDAEGRYHFDFLPLGEELEVTSGGEQYLGARQTARVPGGGDRDVEVNLVLERRPVGGSIQGLVTDAAGKPIARASLFNFGPSSRGAQAFTNAAGRFTLDGLDTSGDDVMVVVKAKGFAPQVVPVTPGPADAPTEIAIKLEPGHRIRGRVLDAAGKPVAEATVHYAKGSELRTSASNPSGSTKTDAQGRFEFDSLPVDCTFGVETKGYRPREGQSLALDGEEEVIVTLPPPGLVRGRVINATTGAPVTAFRVRIRKSRDRERDDPEVALKGLRVVNGEQFEAADGQFVLDDLMVGLPLQVTVEANDFDETTLRRVLAQPASDGEVVEFKLEPTDPAKVGGIAGIIVDEEGRPKPGAQLRLVVGHNQRGLQWEEVRRGQAAKQDGVVQFLSATTDRQGAFHFDRVRLDQEVELWYWGDGVSNDWVGHLEELPEAQREQLRLENPTPGAIEGKISREKFPEAFGVFAIHQGLGGAFHVGFPQPKKGDYQLRNLPPGEYRLSIRGGTSPGENVELLEEPIMVVVEPGKTKTLDIGF